MVHDPKYVAFSLKAAFSPRDALHQLDERYLPPRPLDVPVTFRFQSRIAADYYLLAAMAETAHIKKRE